MRAQLPEYYLTRPASWTEDEAAAFEQVYTAQVRPGRGGRIEYRLDAPRWKFLCWLAETQDVLLHGSGPADITEFEPRRPEDESAFGSQQAVFAASDGIWATFFAVVDRDVAPSLVNACFVLLGSYAKTPYYYYYFSVNADGLARRPWRPGRVHVLPRRTFTRQPESEWAGQTVLSQQWASPVPVKPLAHLDVAPDDFPFLAEVNGHDLETVIARARQDPEGFPWRE